MPTDDDLLRPDGQYDLAKMAARRSEAGAPADLLRKLPLLIKNLKAAAAGDPHRVMTLSVDYLHLIIEMLEAARDALAGQSEPEGTLTNAQRNLAMMEGIERGLAQAPDMTLPTHDEIREKVGSGRGYELESLLFDLESRNPQWCERFRAVLEGRSAVPVVTP